MGIAVHTSSLVLVERLNRGCGLALREPLAPAVPCQACLPLQHSGAGEALPEHHSPHVLPKVAVGSPEAIPPVFSQLARISYLSITSAMSQQAWKDTSLHTGCTRASGTR